MEFHGLQGHSLPHHGLHHELQAKVLCSGVSNTSFPLLLHCPSCLLSFSHIVSLLSLTAVPPQFFPPLLSYVIPEVLPLSLMGSALASGGSVLELAGTGSVGHGGSFWQLLTEATPIAPPLPKF